MPRQSLSLRVASLILIPACVSLLADGQPSTSSVKDTGVRAGAPSAGGPAAVLTAAESFLFAVTKQTFAEVDSVAGKLPGEAGSGLGPSFNMNGCAGCHAFPAVGGSSPAVNPQVAMATMHGARNTVPSFITLDGPIREARFKNNADGTPDGGVHDLFVIGGRSDAPSGCNQQQTNFALQMQRNNVVFRIPTPAFGAGLIEAIPDSVILANQLINSSAKSQQGISGHANHTGNDGSVTRFGWKAQNKSLLIFSGEAYAVEQGVTNEVFPNSRETSLACDTLAAPEDHTDLNSGASSDVVQFATFMRMLAAPQAVSSYGNVTTASILRGNAAFVQAGCNLCHTEALLSGNAAIGALSTQLVPLFSDLLVHDMGSNLADGVAQGGANGNEFRTAPLWGLGQRIYFPARRANVRLTAGDSSGTRVKAPRQTRSSQLSTASAPR